MKKTAAAITMVRDGGFFLQKWVAWYGGQLGKENLYILLDGTDQVPPPCTLGCNVTVLPRVEGNVAEGDRGRAARLSSAAADLLDSYRFVIGTDVDEFITPDPSTGLGLAAFLSALDPGSAACFSPLGCDVVQHLGLEAPLDYALPVLSQRSFAVLSTRYTKASILCRPAAWGSGFHRVRHSNYHILKDLYLFHFGCADARSTLKKQADTDLASRGWSRHLAKRSRLFKRVERMRPQDFDIWAPRARRIQTVLRSPYAWNKPEMPQVLVRIPPRFKELF